MRLMTLPNSAIQGKIGALEDPSYVVYERGIVSVDWNYWPQVEYPHIYSYLSQTPSIYTGESLKAYKSLEAYVINSLTAAWKISLFFHLPLPSALPLDV